MIYLDGLIAWSRISASSPYRLFITCFCLLSTQIVYNSNPNLGFSIGDVVPKTTEYRLQFQQPTEIIEGPTKDELVKAAAEVRRQVNNEPFMIIII